MKMASISILFLSVLILCTFTILQYHKTIKLQKKLEGCSDYIHYLEQNLFFKMRINEDIVSKDLLKLIYPQENSLKKKKGSTIVLYYTSFDCDACVRMAINQLKKLKSANETGKIVVACDKENNRELEAMRNVLNLEIISYQNDNINKLSGGKPLLIIIDSNNSISDMLLLDEKYPLIFDFLTIGIKNY